MEGDPSRWPATIGVLAMVAGATLMAVSAGDDPPRPRVLGEMLVATTTTAPGRTTEGTGAPTTSRRPTPRHATASTRPSPAVTAPSTTATTGAPPSASSSSSAPPTATAASTSTSAPSARPCPSGTPVADVRTWASASQSDGTSHVTVRGVVANDTGAAVRIGPVTVTIERADGDTYAVPVAERPSADPSTIADGGEVTWRWEGDVPSGAAPAGAHAAVTEWAWVDAPPGCITG